MLYVLFFSLFKELFRKCLKGGTVEIILIPLLTIVFLLPWYYSFCITTLFASIAVLFATSAIINPWQVILDWYIPYLGVLMAAFFWKLNWFNYFFGITLATLVGFSSAVVSGILYYGTYRWNGYGIWLYSILYNGIYYLPTYIILLLVMFPIYNSLFYYQRKHIHGFKDSCRWIKVKFLNRKSGLNLVSSNLFWFR